MPWFRWLKNKAADEAPTPAAPPEAIAPAEPDVPAEDTATPADSAETQAQKKRRRGSRGGRGRKKPAAAAAAAGGEPAVEKAEAKPTRASETSGGRSGREGSRRRSGASQQRRKQPPRRAPLPAAKRELLISVDVGEQRVAILEDDRVAEVYLERPERRSIAGNIYLGVVDNVLPGMEAAFVEIGLEKNGFLYVDEIVVPELEGKRHGKKIQDLISRGEKLLVQAVKDPMKTKGARLTTEISLPGRFLVLVPNGEGLGVSRRLDDNERQRLKDILKDIAPKDGGVIVRTAAEGASADDVERDLVFLQRLWKTIQARAKAATAPELVYQEAELPLRIVRDLFTGDFEAAHVDNDRAHKRIVGYLKKTSPHMIERVHRTKEREPLFERFGVEKEIASTLERRVDLPSGGYLIFDYAEAFTVIDVNTGRFVGSRSKSSTQRLEDTIVKNNLEAVKEVVRQLRLRDIGGIIVIDFIDMANPKNRQAVEEALRTELERDRTKTYVVEISPLGLVEMTRQNVTDGPREVMTRKCPTCAGDGIVVSDATTAMLVERKLRALATAGAGSRVQAYRVAVHPRTLALLAGPGGSRLAELEEATRRRFFLVPAEGHAHGDHLEVLAEGRLDDLRPGVALEEGAELEVKLVELGLHDATTGVAKVDGVDVTVAEAARLVGKKASVRVGRVLDGQAFATLVGTAAPDAPITFESEAEKPTRAPARRKPAGAPEEGAPAGEPEPVEQVEADGVDADEEPADEAVDETVEEAAAEGVVETAEGAEGGAPAKKRTRRGSRGGRGRKKRPAPVEGAENGEEVEAEAGETRPAAAEATTEDAPAAGAKAVTRAPRKRTPRIHVPDQAKPAAAEVPPIAEATEPGDGEPAEAAAASGPEEGTDGAVAPRKKTRRGSRGGRGRKKKPAAEGASTGDESSGNGRPDESATESAVDATEAPAPPAPRRPRKAPSGTADGGSGAAAPGGDAGDEAVGPEPVPDAVESPVPVTTEGGYVPMSEWIEDFDRRSGR